MSLEKIWLDNYRFGRHELAHSLEPYPELPLDTILDQAALRNPASIAIDYCGCELSYGQLKDLSERLAAALSALGVKKGDRVVNILPNCPQYIISAFAILKAGAVHVPCSILHPERELQEEISACGAQTVICPADHFERLRPMFGAAGVKNVIITARQDYGAAAPENPPQLHGAMRFTELIAGHEPRLPAVKIDPKKDLAYLAFTGGATGRP
ncbi:MAG: AMP-binding protein, partial [Firmicutes bacterium]|nr:AMP-binding protein [Bacillota bacterium]